MEDYRNKKPIDIAPVIPKTHEGLAIRILKKLKCPLPVYDGMPYNNLKNKLIWLWRRVVRVFSGANEWQKMIFHKV